MDDVMASHLGRLHRVTGELFRRARRMAVLRRRIIKVGAAGGDTLPLATKLAEELEKFQATLPKLSDRIGALFQQDDPPAT